MARSSGILAALGRRLRRISGYGPGLVARLAAHHAGQAVARTAFRVELARGGEPLRFLASPVATAFELGPVSERLRLALWRAAALVYGGAHPVSSDAWLDLSTGAVFCPVWPRGAPPVPPVAALRRSPTSTLSEVIACPPFTGDRKIPQDVGRLSDLWLLVAADLAPPAAAPPEAPRARQARLRDHLQAFFAGATSPAHAVWLCPMDAGIGATNLLFATEHFVGLEPASPEAAALRALRDRVSALALRYVTRLDERTPILENNHHLMNLASAALLLGVCERDGRFPAALAALERALARHFGEDGLLREGSTWYHGFVHAALTFVADVLAAYRPDDRAVSDLRERVARLPDARRDFAAGPELLLVGDADGAVYGPSVAFALSDAGGFDRLSVLRRLPGPGPHARRATAGVVVTCRAEEVPWSAPPASARISTRTHRRRGRAWVTTRLEPAAPAAAPWEVRHLAGFGAVILTAGTHRVLVRTLPGPGAAALGHVHLDLGAVYLGCAEGWLRADPGVVTYTGDPALRARMRSAAAHPTVIPDERQHVRPSGPFSASRAAVTERIHRAPGRVMIEHEVAGDVYWVSARCAAGGAITVRQGTASPRHQLSFPLAPTPSNYGYRP